MIVNVFLLVLHAVFCFDEKSFNFKQFVKCDIKCILFYSFPLFYQLYVFDHFGQSQSFLVSTHEHFSMNNQKMMQELTRMFYIVLKVSRQQCKRSVIKVALKSDITSFVLLIVSCSPL